MLTFFWNCKVSVLEHYKTDKLLSAKKTYCNLLENHLKPSFRSKRHSLLSSGILLQQIMHGFIQFLHHLKLLYICALSLFHILHIHLTLRYMIIMCLDPYGGTRWEEV